MAKTEFNHGAVHEFLVTFDSVGGTEADLTKLTKSKKKCGQLLQFLSGTSQIKFRRLVIDLSADPFCPEGWEVVEHIKAKPWKFDAKQVELYLDPAQSGSSILGNDLRNALKGKRVLNANVLDWLLQEENQHLIPEEWKEMSIGFWGTIYRNSKGDLFVRDLYWFCGRWQSNSGWLGSSWSGPGLAALLASPLQP